MILSSLTLGGLRIAELLAFERGLVSLGVDVIHTRRSKTAAGYREIDVIFAALHRFAASGDLLVPSSKG